MKNLICSMISFLVLLLTFQTNAQSYSCGESAGDLYTVMAKSGLSLRESPSLYAQKIGAVPFGKLITACVDEEAPTERIEGKEGRWVKAFYRGQSGFVFDGYLKADAEIEILHVNSWMQDGFPEDRSYLALVQSNYNQFDPEFKLVDCEWNMDSLELEDGEFYTSRQLANSEQAILLIGGLTPAKKEGIIGRSFDSKFLFPGESVYVGTDQASFHVYAKGSVLTNKSSESEHPFSMIKNYELRVKRVQGDQITDKAVYRMDLPSWMGDGYQGGVHLQWIGDLDGDGELDMLLTVETDDHCWQTVFFLSSKAERGQLFRQVSKYTDCGC